VSGRSERVQRLADANSRAAVRCRLHGARSPDRPLRSGSARDRPHAASSPRHRRGTAGRRSAHGERPGRVRRRGPPACSGRVRRHRYQLRVSGEVRPGGVPRRLSPERPAPGAGDRATGSGRRTAGNPRDTQDAPRSGRHRRQPREILRDSPRCLRGRPSSLHHSRPHRGTEVRRSEPLVVPPGGQAAGARGDNPGQRRSVHRRRLCTDATGDGSGRRERRAGRHRQSVDFPAGASAAGGAATPAAAGCF
jgi:hypothetical protein